MKKITKAVIPAAGLGTRFLPATKAMPKEMLPVVDKPAIQYVVEEAVASGLDDVIMIIGRNKNALANHFDRVTELEIALERTGDHSKVAKVNDSNDLADIHFVR
jgi:UTP--glucose-1-phosphate uridylyltransferase